jgi:hypothetical protein
MMPKLSDHQSNEFTKVLLAGDAMSGKTGALVSLVKAGFKLRILDFDNKLDILKMMVMRECPDKLDNVEYVTLRDKFKSGPAGPVLDGKPTAFPMAMKMLDNWKYDDVDLGKPSEWGTECILVIDSLSRMCDAAYTFNEAVMPVKLSADPRAVYGAAQDASESVLATITSETFRTNVIVIAHVQYVELPDGTTKGFPQGVGQKLSPKIPQYFPAYVLFQNKGGKRKFITTSTALVDLANPAPFTVEKEYSIETGLAEFFAVLREPPVKEAPAPTQVAVVKPKALTLKRI